MVFHHYGRRLLLYMYVSLFIRLSTWSVNNKASCGLKTWHRRWLWPRHVTPCFGAKRSRVEKCHWLLSCNDFSIQSLLIFGFNLIFTFVLGSVFQCGQIFGFIFSRTFIQNVTEMTRPKCLVWAKYLATKFKLRPTCNISRHRWGYSFWISISAPKCSVVTYAQTETRYSAETKAKPNIPNGNWI